MKTFYTDGTGSQQTLNDSQTEKVIIYDTINDAEADLANLAEGQIIATKDDDFEGNAVPVNEVAVNNMHSVTSNAVYNAIKPTSTSIIESTNKRTVSVTAGMANWFSMANYPAPAVPNGKRLLKKFARCSNYYVAVGVGNVVNNGDKDVIFTVSDVSASVDIWLCIEVADI